MTVHRTITLTRKNEEIEVSEVVYQAYRRTSSNIDDNDASFYVHEILNSPLDMSGPYRMIRKT